MDLRWYSNVANDDGLPLLKAYWQLFTNEDWSDWQSSGLSLSAGYSTVAVTIVKWFLFTDPSLVLTNWTRQIQMQIKRGKTNANKNKNQIQTQTNSLVAGGCCETVPVQCSVPTNWTRPKPTIIMFKKMILKYTMQKYSGFEKHAGHLSTHVWHRILEERHPRGLLIWNTGYKIWRNQSDVCKRFCFSNVRCQMLQNAEYQHNTFVDRQRNGVMTPGTERHAPISMKRGLTLTTPINENCPKPTFEYCW